MSGTIESKSAIEIINFGHPMQDYAVRQLNNIWGRNGWHAEYCHVGIDMKNNIETQIISILRNVKTTITIDTLIVLPGLAIASVILLVKLHTILDNTFPKILEFRRDEVLDIYVMKQITSLQEIALNVFQ